MPNADKDKGQVIKEDNLKIVTIETTLGTVRLLKTEKKRWK